MSQPSPEQTPAPQTGLDELLNRAVVALSPEARTFKLRSDRLLAKYQPGRRYLVLTPGQWELLQRFGAGRPVPEVLKEAIAAQRCPSLREFYELVAQSVDAGILQTGAWPVPARVEPSTWPLRLPGAVARWGALVAILAAGVVLALRPALMPPEPWWLALGWLAACVAAGLGAVLAAAVVRAAGGEIYRARLEWRTVLPRFEADTEDAATGGRDAQINSALARLLPVFAALAAAGWWAPGLLVPLLCTALWQLSPLWPSPMLDLLGALYRDPQLATRYGFALARSRLFALLGRARHRMAGGAYLLAGALATVGWLALVFLTGCVLWQANALELLQKFKEAGGWQITTLVLAGVVALLVLGAAGLAGWIVLGHLRAWSRERAERRFKPQEVLMSAESIGGWLARTPLFRDLPAEELAAVAAAVKPEEHKRGSFVVREGEPGEKLYFILSGRLEVRRDYAPGRSEPVAELGEGEVFGEIALLQGGVRTRSIRSLGRSVLLALGKADFERLVLSRLSRQAVTDAVQKVGFLESVELTRHWSHATMAAFAKRAKLQEYDEGAVLVKEGEPNLWLYLVHRGDFSVRQKGKELRRLAQGDSFGELSLLGEGRATASVVATSKTASCLVIGGAEFLDFVTRDYAAGLQWEQLMTKRFGQSVFAMGR